jgi:hypothetical protein
MTPQAFSYATVASNGMIYVPPYGLTECVDYMLKIDPTTYKIDKLPILNSGKTERWTYGIEYQQTLYFLPFNEDFILCVDTKTNSIEHVYIEWPGDAKNIKGRYISFHLYKNKIYSLPYGETTPFDYVMIFDIESKLITFVKIVLDTNDCKKWHTSQMLGNTIYAVPRGERWKEYYFPYGVEFNCDTQEYKLNDFSIHWKDIDQQELANKKYTTLAKANGKLYAPPYSENANFDVMLKFDGNWTAEHTGLTKDSRKYFTNITASNGKIYFPPAGHEEDWSEMLIIDPETDQWYTKDLGISKESKKYFAGVENSQGKIYYMPRGGCACMPTETWKQYGDLAEILVVDTKDDSHYTVDISEYFLDNTTIEKYNCCVILNDVIYAFPYGESATFHTLLVFNTITESVIKTIDLNDI